VVAASLAGAAVAGWQWRRAEGALVDVTDAQGKTQLALEKVTEEEGKVRAALKQVTDEQAKTAAALAETEAAREKMLAALVKLTDEVVFRQSLRVSILSDRERQFYDEVQKLWAEVAAARGDSAEIQLMRARASFGIGGVRQLLGEVAKAELSYREALALYERLAAAAPGRLEYQFAVASTLSSLAHVLRADRPAEAEATYRAALEAFEGLNRLDPDNPTYRDNFAFSQMRFGNLLRVTGRPAEAEQVLRAAAARLRDLVAAHPDEDEYQEHLALCLNNLAIALRVARKPADAEGAYHDSLAISRTLTAARPNNADFKELRALTQINLANLLRDNNQSDAAAAAYREAISTFKFLIGYQPLVPKHMDNYAGACNGLGLLYLRLDRPAEAEQAYRLALDERKFLVANYPMYSDFQSGLAGLLVNLANLKNYQKEYAAALEYVTQARPHHAAAMQSYPSNREYRQYFRNGLTAECRARIGLGDHAGVVVAADELVRFRYSPVEDAVTAATFVTRCVPLAGEDKVLARHYADRAMILLRQAAEGGYKDMAAVERSTTFAPLRGRADFKALAAAVAKGGPLPPPRVEFAPMPRAVTAK
jgi:tetratricopeptide (TPR) repeat protein